MKELINKPATFDRVEFWGVTTIFVFAVFFFITDSLDSEIAFKNASSKPYFDQTPITFQYYRHYFIPKLIRYTFLFSSFLLLNFVVVPKLIKKEGLVWNSMVVIVLFLLGGLVFGLTDTYLKAYLFAKYSTPAETYQVIYQNSFLYAAWLLLVFGFYTVIKYIGQYILNHAESIQSRYKGITREGLVAFVIWMISMFLIIIAIAEEELIAGWGIIIPFAILLYGFSFQNLIPKSLPKRRPFLIYFSKVLLIVTISYLPLALIIIVFTNDEDAGFAISIFNAAFQLLITVPLSWILFKRQMRGNEEIYYLKKELGRSTANFDFLRSQINPHFLFNALNTIYGTALQEKAERTSEGIEKLGDMMRFMLQENMQEKIALARELDYLNNYISFQKLRTDAMPAIDIQAAIEQPVNSVQIAPMLLIPFVENAFKHGISFREPSYIKITLELKGKTLYFDVANSKHPKSENDPEKNKSGIGLNNVKQRLQLLYPAKHELIIRETRKDFFIHLTLHLS